MSMHNLGYEVKIEVECPTEKQVRYANSIHNAFHESLPEFTKADYSKYISRYHQAMQDLKAIRAERASRYFNYGPDEEDIYDYYSVNDVWCEYY